MTKLKVDFGETKLETRIQGTGTLRFCTTLSPSFALFALDLEDDIDYGSYFELEGIVMEQGKTKILDVMLTRKDGWTKDMIDDLMGDMMTTGNRTICVSGYPERREEKFNDKTNIFFVHAVDIKLLEADKVYKAEPPQEDSDVPTTDPSANVNTKTATNTDANTNTAESNKVEDDTSLENGHHKHHNKRPGNKRPKNSDRGANDNSRFAKLAFFLLSEFGGYDGLGSLPVLDVAGGSGGLAFELVFKHQLPCTVVDTRPVQFSAGQKKHLEFRNQSHDALDSIGKDKTTPLVENLKGRFQAGTSDDGLLRQLQTLLETESVLKGLPSSKIRKRADFVEANEKLRELLKEQRCSVLVGLHPDQATDPIMDIGFALNLPWVVIPCCVFPNLFKQRQLEPSGKLVRTYDDLCEYILQQHPSVKETTLPFRGRNRVFYWKPAPSNDE
ncbi:unnamed protein product [Cylindrotheca closterium]|uniref:Uncharacterized protein n=1 Tax=Cylindrotheca closterium TaxID=2856 RepID=A0AAD2CLS3_9STRA|nr:unnamed protein product [Cylindrotheca closterium]